MPSKRKTCSAILATLAAGTMIAGQAHASACVPAEQFDAMIRFALPDAADGLVSGCRSSLGEDAFLNTDGAALIERYRANQNAAWPLARTALRQLNGTGAHWSKFDAVVAQLPDDALRPFVQGMVKQLVATSVKPADCARADRLIRYVAPLPPENMAGLLTVIIQLATAKPKPGETGEMPICPGPVSATLPDPKGGK